MKKKTLAISIIITLIVAIAAWGYYQYKPSAKSNPQGQSSAQNNREEYTKHYSVSGSGEYQDKFVEYQNKLEEAVKAFKDGGDKPDPDYFVEKARYAQYLGHNDWAKEILSDIFTYYDNSSVGWNNLAKAYEADKDYSKANEYYQKMINTFGEKDYWGYYYYICVNWMYAGDKAKAQECYSKYKSFGGSDSQIEDYLK